MPLTAAYSGRRNPSKPLCRGSSKLTKAEATAISEAIEARYKALKPPPSLPELVAPHFLTGLGLGGACPT